MQRKLSMRGLRTFCAAARHQTLRQVADEMYITASAVSHQLKALEDELGLNLFRREGRTLALTEAGEMLYEDIREPMQQVEVAAGHVKARFSRAALSVSVQPFFASSLLMPLLTEFTARYPDVDVSLDASDDSTQTLPGGVDVAIRLFDRPPARHDHERLFPLTLVPACSPALRDQLANLPQDAQAPFPIVVHSGRPDAWKRWAAQSGLMLPFTGSLIRLDSMSAIVQAAEQGLGVALVPEQLTQSAFDDGRLVRLFNHGLKTQDAYYLVRSEGSGSRPDVILFCDWVKAYCAPGERPGA